MAHLAPHSLFYTSYPSLSTLLILSATRCFVSHSLIPLGFPVSCVILFYLSLILSFP
ncbi:hypothetical protein EI94DRAFT_1722956 [Lactarius quietus]|nr:hypothetical protein EI94DRAFT_1722956 [Lactarius quietus]